MSLAGRTALVTGGGLGLGAAIARSVHAAGAEVLLAGRRPEPLRQVCAELWSRARWSVCDVADPASVAALAEGLADTEISVLINNAGVAGPVAPLTEIEVADWDQVFDINVRGVFLLCRAFLPAMVERGGGDVINIASVSGKRPLVRVVATASAGVDPGYMGVGPIPATRKALDRAGLQIDDIDLVEINEAFAAQVLPCMRELGIPHEKLNVNGGAIAIGHPLGCSGARLVGTLAWELRERGLRYGLAALCIGVGQGLATVIEAA